MERKSSKGYSVVFLVEGEKFKLRNLPSAQSAHRLSLQHLAVVLTPNIAEVIPSGFFLSTTMVFAAARTHFPSKNTRVFIFIALMLEIEWNSFKTALPSV